MNNIREEVLSKALECVNGDRDKKYGSPENSFGQISFLWTKYLGVKISPTDVAMMMILLKVSRHLQGTGDMDNFVDIAGYAACAGELFLSDKDAKEARKMRTWKGGTNEKPEL